MKSLVVYYSWGGNTEVTAKVLAKERGADLLKLEEYKERKKGIGFLTGCIQAIAGSKVKIKPINCNVDEYDTIFIGTPVWAGLNTPAINTFIDTYNLKYKRVYLFITMGDNKFDSPLNAISERMEKKGIKVADKFALQTKMKQVIEVEQAQSRVREWLEKVKA